MLVSNSSTLILLAKSTVLSRFLEKTKRITITEIVYKEILAKDSFENLIIKKEIEKERIIIEAINAKFYANILKQFKIEEGEASTFALCKSKKYSGILTDDKELIKLCRIEEVAFANALSILVRLYKEKSISKIGALEKLEKLQAYGRYSKEVFNYFKEMVR